MSDLCRGCSGILAESETAHNKHYACNSLDVYDWLSDLESLPDRHDFVEIRFKNTRKSFFRNVNKLMLEKGDVVAVESSPGHDIGIVSLKGELVLEQMRKYNVSPNDEGIKKVYRKAKPADVEKWKEAISLETSTMLKAREITASMNLNMKIGDVEYQGDITKAIFYYIADERVDFRELIKVLADEFRVRIEMRQVGARQEAGRIGGIGPCGRPLCCSTWLTNFTSVTTNSARIQEISLNPQKLAGQCSKLKCCINYEVEVYNDAKKEFPDLTRVLETAEGQYFFQKSDIFKKIFWYSGSRDQSPEMAPVGLERLREIIRLNIKGQKPAKLVEQAEIVITEQDKSGTYLVDDSLTRFDNPGKTAGKKKSKSRKKKKRGKRQNNDN